MIVLHWLHKEPARAKMYVANRVAETEELTRGCTWRHVPTADSPADLASRGISAKELVKNDLWWHGPHWLKQQQSEWPKSDIFLTIENQQAMVVEESSKPVDALLATAPEPFLSMGDGDLLAHYSSVHRLYRVTVRVFRFIRNCKLDKDRRQTGIITVDEILSAENRWLKEVQRRNFSKEIECCNAPNGSKSLPKGSKLVGLRLFVDAGWFKAITVQRQTGKCKDYF